MSTGPSFTNKLTLLESATDSLRWKLNEKVTPSTKVLLGQLAVAHLAKKLSAFIRVFSRIRHCNLF
jgi:hypothetical protein